MGTWIVKPTDKVGQAVVKAGHMVRWMRLIRTATTGWEEIHFDCVVYARVAAKYVLGVRAKVISLVALAGGGKVEGSKSDHSSLGGNFWIAWFTPAWQAQHVPRRVGRQRRSRLSRRLLVEARLRGRKVTTPVWEEILDCVVHARVAGAARAKYVLGVSVEVTSLSALAGGGRVEGSKSDQAIVGDGGWAEMSAAGVLLL